MLKEKPFWLKLFTSRTVWVTIYPNIYYPETIGDPIYEKEIVIHENVHLKQQSQYGKCKWLWRYVTNKDFRLQQEAEAMAVEVLSRSPEMREEYIAYYSEKLSGTFYHHAATSLLEAELAIRAEITKLVSI